MARTDRTPEERTEHARFTLPRQEPGFHGDTAWPESPEADAGDVHGVSDEDRTIAAALLRDYTPALERLRDL